MRVGTTKEIKDHEDRVGLIPSSVAELIHHGHEVLVETGAGVGAGFTDADYIKAGAKMESADAIWARADMVVKVKEPLAVERKKLRAGQVLFTYLHLAADAAQTQDLIQSGATCIAYETVTNAAGGLPLLSPMSEVAGRMSIQVGAHCLENAHGGSGVLIGGVPGVPPARVLILGGGVSGANAAMVAIGMGADVTVVDRSADVLRRLVGQFGTGIKTVFPTRDRIAELVADSDLVVGTVLIPGAAAPKLVTRAMLGTMRRGSVIVDVSIDQGGCTETSKATTHSNPTYVIDGVIHYCVANMPGGVARTSTMALNNVTLPFTLALADHGWQAALKADPHLRHGLNIHAGQITYAAVGEALGRSVISADLALAA